MRSFHYVVSNSPFIFFMWSMAIVIWTIRHDMAAEKKPRDDRGRRG